MFGHSCDPGDVRRGYCRECGTKWNYNKSNWELTKLALKGVEIRGDDGKRPSLI